MAKNNEPLNDTEEIRSALLRTRFPFEIELLAHFDGAGLDPIPGFRLRVADGATRPLGGDDPERASSLTREVDVMARVHVSKVIEARGLGPSGVARESFAISAQVLAMIEAKTVRRAHT